jgi:ABC-type multidrug transport system ATPase subunit
VKRLINRVSVDAAFFKKLSPMENLLFAARLYGLDAGTAKREATRILARLGIAESRLGRPVEQMSRGMQQKVAIARALLTSPTLLLLDEPTTGLDPRSKLDVQAFVEEVNQAHGATIVLTTHDLAESERLCGRITILDQGRVVAEDSPDGLKRLVAPEAGRPTTLEAVFMTYTGRSLDDDIDDDERSLCAALARSARRQGSTAHQDPERDLDHDTDRWAGLIKARVDGFDLECTTLVRAEDRERLEQLCKYVLRPPLADRRLRRSRPGRWRSSSSARGATGRAG